MATDPYLWPDQSCLSNALGIHDEADLRRTEARIVAVRDVQMQRDPIPGYYNLDHLQRIHHHLFRDVYAWAGETRTVDISKPGSRFAHWRHVDESTSAALRQLVADEYLRGRTRASFVERFAHYYGELNACHPFREGNGRVVRAFLRQLATAAGWRVDWSELSEQQNIEASRRNLQTADPQELAALFDPIVVKL